jgi:hypothetical protein
MAANVAQQFGPEVRKSSVGKLLAFGRKLVKATGGDAVAAAAAPHDIP